MEPTTHGIVLSAGGRRWTLYVREVVRVREDWFVQIIAMGPRACTVFVRTDDPDLGAQAVPIFRRIGEWLSAGTLRDCVFLDLVAE